jgi:hypothetical protein
MGLPHILQASMTGFSPRIGIPHQRHNEGRQTGAAKGYIGLANLAGHSLYDGNRVVANTIDWKQDEISAGDL